MITKPIILKYGLMVGFVSLSLLIAIGLVNITLTPPEFNSSISRSPLFLPVLII